VARIRIGSRKSVTTSMRCTGLAVGRVDSCVQVRPWNVARSSQVSTFGWLSTVVYARQVHGEPRLLTAADVFVCPSVYEPLGIVNLEAMACGTAVVGTATGGIPEVIVDGETGRLVPIEQATDGTGTPLDPDRFVADLGAALAEVVSDRPTAARYGEAGRARAEAVFDWDAIGAQTVGIYRSLVDR